MGLFRIWFCQKKFASECNFAGPYIPQLSQLPAELQMNAFPQPAIVADMGACLVVNKPGGLLTQGPPGIDSLERQIKTLIRTTRDSNTGKVYLGVPHRLDRPASGVMLFARNVRAARRLASQFRDRTVGKKYWAVVEGCVAEDAGQWTDYMRKLPDQAKSVISCENAEGSQMARLRFSVIARNDRCSWLEIELQTGRTHQIRLQTSHRGHPIIGDWLYGGGERFGPVTHDIRKRWIALHAREICFSHPISRERLTMTAPLWDHWRQFDFELPFEHVAN